MTFHVLFAKYLPLTALILAHQHGSLKQSRINQSKQKVDPRDGSLPFLSIWSALVWLSNKNLTS